MIPSALSGQLQQGLADFLRFSFWSSTPGMEQVIDDLLDEPGGLLKGPYVSLKLPFVAGKNPDFFPHVPMGFTPHLHQEQAFTRLSGRRKLSTLVATGTGSGKTESFLLPILDHCLNDSARKGVKAILIYPMNALATDQAGRIARMIHGNDRLRGTVRAGLYIGEDRGKGAKTATQMGPTSIITDRAVMKDAPPDILLTNYKMLDYLLLRPSDQGVWQHNGAGALKYLVVDEIHTFDGAQGTDLACLIRRLKRRLQVDDGSLCCVGTSATLGGEESSQKLIDYAYEVFGEPFDSHAVIAESRVGERAYLAGCGREWTDEPTADDVETMNPARWTDPDAWIRAQAALWFGEDHAGQGDAWAVELGQRLKHHAAFHSLLVALGGDTVDLERLVAHMARQRTAWRDQPTLGRLALTSLIGLVSAARAWRPELPEVAEARQAAGEPRPVQPFLDVRVQLWQRELRRMVASLSGRPRLRHSMDLDKETRHKHLPLVHCRECGAMGWATVAQRDKPEVVSTTLDRFYRAFFSADPQVQFLFPAEAGPENDASWPRPAFEVDLESMTKVEADGSRDAPVLRVVPAHSVKATQQGPELSRDCPFCGAGASLTLLGFRAATLTSVYIDQIFASPFNDDKKLLAFSDSVQDAAHRAGFFGARTWRTTLRMAMLQVIGPGADDGQELTLAGLAQTLGPVWRRRLSTPAWVSTFLATNMTWLHDWGLLKAEGKLPEDSNLDALVARRLQFEVVIEFGLQAGIGRSLPRTGTAAVALDGGRLAGAVEALLEPLQNEVPGLRDLDAITLERFIVGLLHHLRTRGGILDGALPHEYVASRGRDLHAFKRDYALPAYAPSSRVPRLLTDRAGARFETWGSSSDASWYTRWVPRCLGQGAALTADAASTYPLVLPALVRAGLLRQTIGKKQEAIWGLDAEALIVTRAVTRVACQTCGQAHYVAEDEGGRWTGVPCLTARCPGQYGLAPAEVRDYFASLYSGGDLQRIFTDEHTGLLTRAERETVEREFKARPGPAQDPAARKPWYPNLLSCTPTLEMGIDIGDLSTTILCSVPPAQANYLQRIGRAGRQDGNAFVLTVAGGRPHDLYFFADPAEMFAGEVSPPGIFLDAPAVLERQLTAFCFDRWVAARGAEVELPHQLRTVFGHLDDTGSAHFPFNFLAFVKGEEPSLLREFGEMFSETISGDTVEHLRRYMLGTDEGRAGLRWHVLETLQRERAQRDSLANKARALREEIKRLKTREAKPADHDEVVDQLDREKDALLALVAGINRRRTLEFLTEEGLLPNYAFPEAAVSLKSVIWRKKKVAPASGSSYETWTHEYKRSPASALSELAPHADFYAGGRRVRIDQIDVAVSKAEDWRFCADCNHAQRIDTGDEAKVCPACGSVDWSDDGQRFRLMKLQQVFANAPDRDSRIRDDRDERQPRFFQRQVMVDIKDEDRAGAWHVDDERVPFGFEYLKRATFREINFGEPTDQGAASTIAGRETVRPGFQVCARCGMVQTPKKDPAHALSCPSRKKGAKQEIEDCLYLYREFQSEALRLLLPLVDIGGERQLNSFVAALQVGLKARFKGSVDHLRTTLYSDPVEGSALRKQYLVLFDSVPGGTGYLKQLVTRQSEGDRMPLYEILDMALAAVEGCVCWDDSERDGCYACLYAYRNARDMDDTSAKVASDLLRMLLGGEDKLTPIDSLGNVSITQLMDSVLELRFVEALRLITGPGGARAKLKPSVLQPKSGYRWSLGDAEWVVEPQVNPPPSESCGVPVSIDFVMRPATATSDRKIAIFLDGWTYHKDRVGQDLRQRMALLASGQWDVWSFTWADIDQKLGLESAEDPLELAIPDQGALRKLLQQVVKGHAGIGSGSVFDWFEAELLGGGVPWHDVASCVLAARMAPALVSDGDTWAAFVDEVAPVVARESLKGLAPRQISADLGEVNPHFRLMTVHDGQEPALVCTLDDSEALYEAPEYKAAWRGYLRLFQLLRRSRNAWFMTRSSTDQGALCQGIALARGAQPDGDAPWAGFDDIEPEFRELATRLMDAGVAEPEVGMEILTNRGDTWAEGELVWEDRRVALTSRAGVELALGQPADDWQVFYLDDLADDPLPLVDALERTEGS